jgi:hypothetical protein
MTRRTKIIRFPGRSRRWRAVIIASCWLAIGFGIGIIATLKVVGF